MNATITLLISAACLAVLSLKRIPEGQAYTIYRFGRYRRTLDAWYERDPASAMAWASKNAIPDAVRQHLNRLQVTQ